MNQKYLIIPDLHGRYEIFIKMLNQFVDIKDNKIINKNNYKIIILGDFIDKGELSEQIKLLNFLYDNKKELIILIGNHEYKTKKKLELKHKFGLTEFYDFYKELEINQSIKNKFDKLYKHLIKYYEDEFIICTHAPCLYKHLDKKTEDVIQYVFKKEINFNTKEEYKKYLNNYFKEILTQNNYKKLHIAGHIGIDKPIFNNKQIWLDTKKLNDINFLIIENNNFKIINSEEKKNNFYKEDTNFILKKLVKKISN